VVVSQTQSKDLWFGTRGYATNFRFNTK